MRSLFVSTVILSSVALAPAAFAATMSTTSTVKAFTAGKSLTLANGDMFILSSKFKNPGIKAGEKVKVAYTTMGKKLEAQTVSIVK
jgi:hypothetical protein